MFLNGYLLHLLVCVLAHVVDKACKIVFLADTAEFLVELAHDDMHTYIVLWARTGLVVASIIEVIRAGVSAVSSRNHVVAAYGAFDEMAERQEVFAVRSFLVFVASRLDRAAVFSKHLLDLVEFFLGYHWLEVWRDDTQIYIVAALFQDAVVERIVKDTVCGAFANAVASHVLVSA